jgi:putative sterol carrier protein
MGLVFPSEEWVAAYEKAIQDHDDYKEGGKNWTFGVTVLIITAEPEIGVDEDFYIYLDLERGVCKECRTCTPEECDKQPFVIRGDFDRWREVVNEELEPVKGMMQGKLRLRGDLPTIVRNISAAKALVKCTSYVDTVFIDEQ